MKGKGKEAVVKYVKEDEEEEGQRTENKNSGEGNDERKEIESGKKTDKGANHDTGYLYPRGKVILYNFALYIDGTSQSCRILSGMYLSLPCTAADNNSMPPS